MQPRTPFAIRYTLCFPVLLVAGIAELIFGLDLEKRSPAFCRLHRWGTITKCSQEN